jgi:hypothetical protein
VDLRFSNCANELDEAKLAVQCVVAVDSVGLGQRLHPVLADSLSNTGVCDIVSRDAAMDQVGEIVNLSRANNAALRSRRSLPIAAN